jgi:hypothetical protein
MQLEFFTPAPGTFQGTTFFRELGSDKYVPIDQLDPNKQNILFQLFLDNNLIRKYIVFLRTKGVISLPEILSKCIERYFPKLDHVLDVDENKLNIEVQ